MPRPQGKDERPFITVTDSMPEHPKVEPLSDAAFRALVEIWCYCGRSENDGLLTLASWSKRAKPRALKELLDAGLAEKVEGGVQMHDYPQHQRTAAEIAEIREGKSIAGKKGAAIGNHRRYHVAKDRFDPACEYCAAPEPNSSAEPSAEPRHQPTESLGRTSANGSAKRRTDSDTDSVGTSVGTQGGGSVPREPTPERPPNHCPDHPGGTTAPCGACGSAKRRQADWDAADRRRTAEAASTAAKERARLRQLEVDACGLCDGHGYRVLPGDTEEGSGGVCDHIQRQPGAKDRAFAAVTTSEKRERA